MKRQLFFLLALVAAMGISNAQSQDDLQQARQHFHPQDAPQQHSQSASPKTSQSRTLPDNRWFPGAWEEVQAIVSSVPYRYYPVGHVGDPDWEAVPYSRDSAACYMYYSDGWHIIGWQFVGNKPYESVLDTENPDYCNAFLYIIDAVQMGGAESWVRVEHLSDSTVVLSRLQQLGLRHNNVHFFEGLCYDPSIGNYGPMSFYYGDQDSLALMDFRHQNEYAYPDHNTDDDSIPYLIGQQMGIPTFGSSIHFYPSNCVVDGAGRLFSTGSSFWADFYPNPYDTEISQATLDSLNRRVLDTLQYIMAPRGIVMFSTYQFESSLTEASCLDLFVDMIDENQFVFSKMTDEHTNWPVYPMLNGYIDEMLSMQSIHGQDYYGSYIQYPRNSYGNNTSGCLTFYNQVNYSYTSHTFVNNVIIVPVSSPVVDGKPTVQWDIDRFNQLYDAYPGYTLYPINMAIQNSPFGSWFRGSIRTLTSQIHATSPLRILHAPLHGKNPIENGDDVTLSATITNNTGIANASVMIRSTLYSSATAEPLSDAKPDWEEYPMTADSNRYTAIIPASHFATDDSTFMKVEYYITATSNGGKTITKPRPADQGGYFVSYYGSQITLGIEQTDGLTLGQFYPNPANGQSSIEVHQACEMQVCDMMGRVVYQHSLPGEGIYTLNTQSFAKGLYLVVFTTPQGREVRKLMVD